jgi:CRISPR-associated protein Cmr2
MDGDNMGGWLRGENSPQVGEVLHPDLREYFARLSDTKESLAARRPVGPALHAAISEALTNFALYAVPRIVRDHLGTLIYSGGDDVLALLPASTALACARELRLAFCGDPRVNGGARSGYYRDDGQDLLMMGSKATASAGLAVVHYKEDLRFALNAARGAERAAKGAGRDILRIIACRRSGEHAAAFCPWEFVDTVQRWVEAFSADASDRWAYHLRAELPTLTALDHEAVLAEIRRQLGRTEQTTKERLPPDAMAAAFDAYSSYVSGTLRVPLVARTRSVPNTLPAALEGFVTLCQTASFLARGRE